MIKALLLTALMAPGAAQGADAWAFAQDRCLSPMEEVAPAVTDGLAPLALPQDAFGAIYLTEGGWPMLATSGTIAVEVASCWVLSAPGDTTLADGFATWRAKALEGGRYVALEGEDAPALESFEWREPRLRITLIPPAEGSGSVMRVWEVPLEA